MGGYHFAISDSPAAYNKDVIRYYQYLQNFIDASGVRFWDMLPDHALVGNPSENSCLAHPGEAYLIYVLNDTSITVDLSALTGSATYRTYNPKYRAILDYINSGPPNTTFGISTFQLPSARVGLTYGTSLQAANAVAPLRWSISGLPAFLSLDSATGSITGIPPISGTFPLEVQLEDAENKTDNRALDLLINPAPIIPTQFTLVFNFNGSDPGQEFPWTSAAVPSQLTLTQGLTYGSSVRTATGGMVGKSGDNEFRFGLWNPNKIDGNTSTKSTLADALAADNYVVFKVAFTGPVLNFEGGELRFTYNRYSGNAPQDLAVFTNATGFAAGQQIASFNGETGEIIVPLSGVALANRNDLEVRIYLYDAQYNAAHQASFSTLQLRSAEVTHNTPEPTGFERWQRIHFTPQALENIERTGPMGSPLEDGVPNKIKYALGYKPTDPMVPISKVAPKADGRPTYAFRRAKLTPPNGLVVEASTTLETWDADFEIEVAEDTAAYELMHVSPPADSTVPGWFIRLKTP